MKKYELKGGGIIQAEHPEDLIKQLRALSFNPCETLQDYIIATANACFLQNGSIIRTSKLESFFEDLIEYEFIRIIE